MSDVAQVAPPPPGPPPLPALSPVDRAKRRRNRIELVAAILIGVAAIFTALATYLGGQVDGSITEKQNEALRLDLIAGGVYNDANAQQAIERDWVFGWITELENETPAAGYLENAMPDEVFALAEEWINAEDDVADPFSEEAFDSYESHSELLSAQLSEEASFLEELSACSAFDGQVLEVRGENYSVSQVFFATTLVAGGIAALLRRRLAQYIVLGTAVLSLLAGLSVLSLGTDEADARAEIAADFYAYDDDNEPTLTAQEALAIADEQCPS